MNKNLIIITSIINPPNTPLSYVKTRSIFTKQQRYEQLLETINSVKKYIPNYYIVLLECSDEIELYEDYLKIITDKYINYNKNINIKNNVNGIYKSLGEWSKMIEFINNENLDNYNSLIKISGRYFLNDKFNYDLFNNDDNVFRYYIKYDIVSTRLYKISKTYFDKYKNIMNSFETELKSGISIENIMTNKIKYNKVEYIGLSGKIAIKENDFIDE